MTTLNELFPELENFQQELEEYLTLDESSTTQKRDTIQHEYLKPIIDPRLSRYVYHRCDDLQKVLTVYAKDVILNDFSLEDVDENDENIELINAVWNNNENKIQLYYAVLEYFIYGYGALEIIQQRKGYSFQQIPAHTIKIRVEPLTSTVTGNTYQFYFLEQEINGIKTLLKFSHLDYTLLEKYGGEGILEQLDYDNLNECLWFGGCNEDQFFDIPAWESCSEKIYTNIAIKKMNLKKINKGNVPAGVLMFEGPPALPDPDNPDEKRIDHILEENIDATEGGTMFTYITSDSEERGVTMQYQSLVDNNYEYFNGLEEANRKSIYKCIGVPPIRLMLMDQKESMNSDKSDKVFSIYCDNEIRPTQMLFKSPINQWNRKYLKITSSIVIDTPEFVDKTGIRIDNILKGFNAGLLTLGQALEGLVDIYPQLDLQRNVDDPELLNMRFYNGNALGTNNNVSDKEEQYTDMIKGMESYLNNMDSI